MSHKPEKFIAAFITDERSSLKKLMNQLQQLDKIAIRLKELLPEEFVNRVTVANYRQGCLILQTDNGAWATKLRFQIPTLLYQLRAEKNMPELVSIEIQVQP